MCHANGKKADVLKFHDSSLIVGFLEFLNFNNITDFYMKNIRFFRYLFSLFVVGALSGCGGGGASAAATPAVPVPLAEVHILVIGQSISSNCNEKIYGPVENVFQIGKDGELKAASDPFEWADCKKGSMWMPLGKRLIDAGVARKVVFMPIGIAATSVQDWQAGGAAFSKLNSAIDVIQKKGIKFDFVFWHQGSSNVGTEKAIYKDRLSAVIDYVNGKIPVDRWLIAVHSRCYGAYDRNIEAAQIEIGDMTSLKRYRGANNNSLGDDFRFDGCHLTGNGQESMASMWLDSVKTALK